MVTALFLGPVPVKVTWVELPLATTMFPLTVVLALPVRVKPLVISVPVVQEVDVPSMANILSSYRLPLSDCSPT